MLLGMAVIAVLPAGSARAEGGSVIKVEGSVYEVPGSRVLFVDRTAQRLYATGGDPRYPIRDVISEYDLTRSPGAMYVRSAHVPGIGNWRSPSVDPESRTAYLLDGGVVLVCLTAGRPCRPVVQALDLDTLTVAGQWDLSRLLPGLGPVGMTFSPADRRLYVLSVVGDAEVAVSLLNAPVSGVVVAAIDIDAPADTSVAWVRPIKTCALPQINVSSGARLYHSENISALYFGCMRTDPPYVGAQNPGRPGVVRLVIDPKARDVEGALSPGFREEFFRVPASFSSPAVGNYTPSAFDPVTDRVVFVSKSPSTPGAWVFDGLRSVWAGYIPTQVDGRSTQDNSAIGIDPVTGVIAIRETSRGMRFVNIRSTPVPLGEHVALPEGVSAANEGSAPIWFGGNGRLYWMPQGGTDLGNRGVTLAAHVPPVPPPSSLEQDPLTWDRLTQDIPEGPDTLTSYVGGSSGFGARVTSIGGPTGATSLVWNKYATFFNVESQVGTTPFIGGSDRGVHIGRLTTLDLRASGAEVSAQAVTPDDTTRDDDRTARDADLYYESTTAVEGAGQTGGTVEAPLESQPDNVRRPASGTSWPWPAAFCSDGGGDAKKEAPSTPGGTTTARCDLRAFEAEAASEGPGVRVGNVSIADAGITSLARRQPGRMLVETSAWSRGIEVDLGTAGTVRIGEVSQSVLTESGGRTGTARVSATRSIEGVEVRNASGGLLFACGDACDPSLVAAHVNDVLGGDLRMTVPTPEVIATPRGAYARFREPFDRYVNDLIMNNDASEAVPALQLEVFTDMRDKSRTLIQLAAIDSSSVYGITANGSDGAASGGEPSVPCPDCSGGSPSVPDPSFGALPDPVAPSAGGAGGAAQMPWIAALPVRIAQQALFLARSPAEAASMILVLSLAAGFVALSIRRRALGGVL